MGMGDEVGSCRPYWAEAEYGDPWDELNAKEARSGSSRDFFLVRREGWGGDEDEDWRASIRRPGMPVGRGFALELELPIVGAGDALESRLGTGIASFAAWSRPRDRETKGHLLTPVWLLTQCQESPSSSSHLR
jgi:hypothetical protein